HSPWIAEIAWNACPFHSVEELHQTMTSIVAELSMEKKLHLLKAHPDLAARVKMTSESVQEQKGAGLDRLTEQDRGEIIALNNTYTEKFGFPFIMAVRGQSIDLIQTAMKKRVQND